MQELWPTPRDLQNAQFHFPNAPVPGGLFAVTRSNASGSFIKESGGGCYDLREGIFDQVGTGIGERGDLPI